MKLGERKTPLTDTAFSTNGAHTGALDGSTAATMDGPEDTREYECKLGGGPAQLRAVKKAAAGLSKTPLAWTQDNLESIYYDTQDLRLGVRRVALRVRRKKGRFIQTVKTENDGAGVLFDRGEWEQEVDGMTPRLDVLPPAAVERVGLVLPGELTETFRTVFTRERAEIVCGGGMGPVSRMEIALDRGEVVSGSAREPISEVELELIEGDPRDLFEVALALQQAAGLHIVQEAKAARGYRLLNPTPVKPVKAAKTVLRPGETVNQAIAETLRNGTRQMLANEAPSLDGDDPEGVHQFRVAVRRMRSMLSVFNKLLAPNRVDWLKAELKWIADQFGPARDWDVFIDEILGPVQAAGIEPVAMAALRQAAETARKNAYVLVRDALNSPRYAALVLKLSAFTETQGWSPQPCPPDHPLADTIEACAPRVLGRAHKKALRAGEGLADLDIPARHNLRIRVKKLRYTTDFLQALYPAPEKKKYLKALERLQDDFGHLNDVAVAERLIDELMVAQAAEGDGAEAALAAAAGAVGGWHARGLHDSEPRLLADWEQFTQAPPFWRGDR